MKYFVIWFGYGSRRDLVFSILRVWGYPHPSTRETFQNSYQKKVILIEYWCGSKQISRNRRECPLP